jgi:hypothetical protein
LIKVVVGFASGGGHDVYARPLARHFGKYIPGNPTLVVHGRAGRLRAANYPHSPDDEGFRCTISAFMAQFSKDYDSLSGGGNLIK